MSTHLRKPPAFGWGIPFLVERVRRAMRPPQLGEGFKCPRCRRGYLQAMDHGVRFQDGHRVLNVECRELVPALLQDGRPHRWRRTWGRGCGHVHQVRIRTQHPDREQRRVDEALEPAR